MGAHIAGTEQDTDYSNVMNSARIGAFGIACVVLLFSPSLAQDGPPPPPQEDFAQSPDGAEPLMSYDGIETYAVFPGVHDGRFALGDVHKQLVGVKNNADVVINITSIEGALLNPFDHTYYVQNFTPASFGMPVAPGEAVSLLYRYAPHTSLDPMVFQLSTVLQYTVQNTEKVYQNALYNQTIELYEPASTFDTKKTMSFVVGVAMLFGLSLSPFHLTSATDAKMAKSSKPSGSASNQWVQEGSKRKSRG